MFRVGAGALPRLRWGILSLSLAVALVSVTGDPADAARKRKRVSKSQHRAAVYQPPYAAIVVDANSGAVLHATNADSLRHPASLTKIMTLYLLFERLESGQMRLDTPMRVSAYAASQAPSKLGLRPGETIEVEDAIKALVTKSANDAAVVIAEAIAGDEDEFARMMTRKARALGMTRTVYKNANGLPDPDQVTTARDQALLGRAIQERFPRYYRYFSTTAFTYKGRTMRNHNKLLGRVEGVDGIKTGYIRASGFNLVTSVRRGNRHIVAVVLGGRTGASRDARMRELIGEYITVASTTRTAPAIVETPSGHRVASAAQARPEAPSAAEPRPARSDPAPTATVAQPRAAVRAMPLPKPGSLEPIKPVAVKTIAVKAGSANPGTLTAVPVPMAQAVPPEFRVTSAASSSDASSLRTATVPVPLPPVSPVAAHDDMSAKRAESADAPAAEHRQASKPPVRRGWMVQVGAFPDEQEARERLNSAQARAKRYLGHADPFTEPVTKGDKVLYRARFAGLEKDQAEAACRFLKRNDIVCMTIKN